MTQTIEVTPLPSGWAVRSPVLPNDLIFARGSAAEGAARSLAERLSAAGQPVKLTIKLKDGSIAGRFVLPPRASRTERASNAPVV